MKKKTIGLGLAAAVLGATAPKRHQTGPRIIKHVSAQTLHDAPGVTDFRHGDGTRKRRKIRRKAVMRLRALRGRGRV